MAASPKKARMQSDKLTDWFNQGNSIGTGPYRLAQWDIANEIILENNADYWGDALHSTGSFQEVADSSTRLQLLETGEADFAFSVDPDQMQQVADNPGLQLIEGPSLAYEYLALNATKEVGGPLARKRRARQSLTRSITGIIDGLVSGHAIRPATVVPLGLLGADEVAKQGESNGYRQEPMSSGRRAATVPTELTLTYGAGQSRRGPRSRCLGRKAPRRHSEDRRGHCQTEADGLERSDSRNTEKASCNSPCRTGHRTTPTSTPTPIHSGGPAAPRPSVSATRIPRSTHCSKRHR